VKRINEAADFVAKGNGISREEALKQLAISPQCGFLRQVGERLVAPEGKGKVQGQSHGSHTQLLRPYQTRPPTSSPRATASRARRRSSSWPSRRSAGSRVTRTTTLSFGRSASG
jgi:hypothetical protein